MKIRPKLRKESSASPDRLQKSKASKKAKSQKRANQLYKFLSPQKATQHDGANGDSETKEAAADEAYKPELEVVVTNTSERVRSKIPTAAETPEKLTSSSYRTVPICGDDTPDSTYENIGRSQWTELIEIEVGCGESRRTKRTFIVHRSVLRNVWWFCACLFSQIPMQEVASGLIKMPEDDPDAFEELIHFLYFEKYSYSLLEECEKYYPARGEQYGEYIRDKILIMIRTYILAKKLDVEKAKNTAIDAVISCLRLLDQPSAHCLTILNGTESGDKLRKAYFQDTATLGHRLGLKEVVSLDSFAMHIVHDVDPVMVPLQAMNVQGRAEFPWMGRPCDFHTHEHTDPCT